MRRAEIGHHHRIAGAYLVRYGQDAASCEANRRMENGRQVRSVSTLAMAAPTSVDCADTHRDGGRRAMPASITTIMSTITVRENPFTSLEANKTAKHRHPHQQDCDD